MALKGLVLIVAKYKQLILIIVFVFIIILTLQACAEQKTPSPDSKTEGPIFTTQNAQVTAGAIVPVAPTEAVAPTPTLVPTPTIAPTPTLVPTPTIAPTATAIPSPTPTPLPDKIIIGDINDPFGEITRYDASGTDQLTDLPLNEQTLSEMSNWFQSVSELKPNISLSGTKQNKFKLKISPGINQRILQGSVLPGGIKGQISFGFGEGGLTISPSFRIITPRIPLSPNVLWNVVTFIGSQAFIVEIDSQFEKVNEKLDSIKSFLEEKEYSVLEGDLKYLDTIRNTLTQQKLSEQDLDSFRNQLEAIERETLQSISLSQTQMDDISKKISEIKLDKTLVFFPNDDWITQMNDLVKEYNQKGEVYLAALEVRVIASQTRAALPTSRDLALSRLETVQNELAEWDSKEVTFYDFVAAHSKEIAGQYGKMEKAVQFEQLATDSKSAVGKIHSDINVQLSDAIQEIKAQTTSSQEPVVLVVEVDGQGKVSKASKLTNG
jgi:hypothetical protein